MESKVKVIDEECKKIENSAEKFLSAFSWLILVISMVLSISTFILFGIIEGETIFILYSLGTLLSTYIVFCFIKVFINISNNLHKINAKLNK